MRVLALYDIHGNVDALDAVLADPAARGVDAVVVGGDAVPGRYARRTLELLRGIDAPVHWVRGNGEREVAAEVGAAAAPAGDLARVTAQLTANELDDDEARALGELPLTVELDGVCYCHATPRDDAEM